MVAHDLCGARSGAARGEFKRMAARCLARHRSSTTNESMHWTNLRTIDAVRENSQGVFEPVVARLVQCPMGHEQVITANFETLPDADALDVLCVRCDALYQLHLKGE